MTSRAPLSVLDLATVGRGMTVADSLAASVALAQTAEQAGYTRVWYAEHHNMPAIASSAPAVLIAHIAAHTRSIRLGSGGVMLPNHSPLVVAEQFGMLEALHPGRIDLGLGRAPGTDGATFRALRRDLRAADRFPDDVLELQAFLSEDSPIPGVEAHPGRGTRIPLYILGSSLFGAQLAAMLGLPYAFASHFAPAALQDAVAIYRQHFRPSAQLAEPHVIAAANVVAADTTEEAQGQWQSAKRSRLRSLTRSPDLADDEADALLASPQGRQIEAMVVHAAVGTPETVRDELERFVKYADADELIVALQSPGREPRMRSAELLAEAWFAA